VVARLPAPWPRGFKQEGEGNASPDDQGVEAGYVQAVGARLELYRGLLIYSAQVAKFVKRFRYESVQSFQSGLTNGWLAIVILWPALNLNRGPTFFLFAPGIKRIAGIQVNEYGFILLVTTENLAGCPSKHCHALTRLPYVWR
jgi:hypothetical protein